MKGRLRPLAVIVGIVVAVLGPVTWPHGRDSFPLTPYPMFADSRSDPSISLVIALGDTPSGPVVLPTEATGHGQLTQAVVALADAVRVGGTRPSRLCDEIAAWTSGSERRDVELIRLVTASFDGIEYLVHGEREPKIAAEHARCEVER